MRQRSVNVRFALTAAVCLSFVVAACGSDDRAPCRRPLVRPPRPALRLHPPTPLRRRRPRPRRQRRRRPRLQRPHPLLETFAVPTDNCPADTTAALADGAPVKIRVHRPPDGSVGHVRCDRAGHEGVLRQDQPGTGWSRQSPGFEVITKDDAYDPAKSAPAVQEALEGDKIFASVFQIGTPNVAGTRQLYADACVPQALVGTGFPAWGDPNNFPWTTGGIPSYTVEAKVWVEFIKQKFPDAKKVTILSFNNDFGKSYKTTLGEALPAAGYEIVADVAHEAT